jgi:1-acyl-sn-glycerol-3-phosphate acyltransferase
MQLIRWTIITALRVLARVLLRVEIIGMDRLPQAGPVIVAINHTNSVDGLLLRAILPREIIGWGKVELWHNPFTRILAQSLRTIPLRRGELDVHSVRLALQALEKGQVLGIAPEGTRSWHGRMQRGRPGLILLAQHAPETLILPVAIYGQDHLSKNLRRLRRTPVKVVFGQGFHLAADGGKATHELRQEMIDEVMAQIASLLPIEYRGVYSDLAAATDRHLCFPTGTGSNLRLVASDPVTGSKD